MRPHQLVKTALVLLLVLAGCSKAELQGSIAHGLQKSCEANKERCTVVNEGEGR